MNRNVTILPSLGASTRGDKQLRSLLEQIMQSPSVDQSMKETCKSILDGKRPVRSLLEEKDFTELMRKGVGIMQKKLEGMSEQEKVQLKNKSIDEAERMDYLA